MTKDLPAKMDPLGRERTPPSAGYGGGAMVAGGVIAALLIPALILGGMGAASAITRMGAVNSTQLTEAPPTQEPGDGTPGSDDPSTPPDRGSDQTGAASQKDKIYYIQEGDTLTALSARFGMSIDAIANYNAVRDVNVISEGAALRVPFIYVPPAVNPAG